MALDLLVIQLIPDLGVRNALVALLARYLYLIANSMPVKIRVPLTISYIIAESDNAGD